MAALLPALSAGALAGLGVALPLGAIGVLLLQEGLTRGWRSAAAGATGIALVDFGYATLAMAAGTAVTATLSGHTRTIQLAGALVLTVVAVRGLIGLRSRAGRSAPSAGSGPTQGSGPTGRPEPAGGPHALTTLGSGLSSDPSSGRGSGSVGTRVQSRPAAARTLGRFVALTAINPLTAVYFVVLAAGLGHTTRGAGAASAFVLGVFVASWAWQLVLASTGALAGARMPDWTRVVTGLAGYLVVLGYAVRLAVG